MVTHESLRRSREEWEEAVRENPLLEFGLGRLVAEMQKVSLNDHNVLLPENEVPEESRKNYEYYQSLVSELDRRGKGYNSYKMPPKIGMRSPI